MPTCYRRVAPFPKMPQNYPANSCPISVHRWWAALISACQKLKGLFLVCWCGSSLSAQPVCTIALQACIRKPWMKNVCAAWSTSVITVETGIKRLYLQQGHPAYLLSKLAVEICVYIHMCETHWMFIYFYPYTGKVIPQSSCLSL